MKTKIKFGLLGLTALALPIVSFAQTPGSLSTFENLVRNFTTIVNLLVPIAFTLGLLGFFWGLVKYIFGADHDKDQAKKTMLWGVVALFVMAAVWGLVSFIGRTFNIDTTGTDQNIPGVTP